MRVGFDARMIAYRQAGIGQYCLNLLRELVPLQAGAGDFELEVYQSRKQAGRPADWLELPPGLAVGKRSLWTPPHHRLEQLALPLELTAGGGLEVLHSPDFVPPLRRRAWRNFRLRPLAGVITIHDLAFLRFPHLLTEESARYYGQVGEAARSAERIIAVSRSTANDIVERLGVGLDKVRVVYEAASPLFQPLPPAEIAELGQLKASLVAGKLSERGVGAEDGFWLFVSTLEPRKNVPTLLAAYRRFLDGLPEDQTPLKLVLAGREGWLYQDIYILADELNLKPHLVWLGEVSSEELLYLYNRATALAMPSLYEGFGLPPLEALACGCPVIVADISSLPEVVGSLGTLVPPEGVEEWALALLDLWHKRAERKAAAQANGPEWARNFSWRRAAQETLAVYREAWEAVKQRA